VEKEVLKHIEERLQRIEECLSKQNNSLMDIKECAEFLKCSERTIRELVRQNKIPHYRLNVERGRSKLLFNRKKILLWLECSGKTSFTKRDRERIKYLD